MTNVVVTIEYGNRQRADLAIPLDVPCRLLAASLGKALNLESDVEQAFTLTEADSPGGQRLPANSTLSGAGILNGRILRLSSERVKEARSIPQGGAWLQSENGQSFSLVGAYTLLGRSDPRHNILPDIDLTELDTLRIASRRHACIEFNQVVYTVTDLGSANGTWLNGRRLQVKTAEPLSEGDEITFGRNGVRLSFSRGV
jgi:hypothetical protein